MYKSRGNCLWSSIKPYVVFDILEHEGPYGVHVVPTIDTLYPTQDRKLFILCIKSIHYNTYYAYKLLNRKHGSVSRLDRIVEEQSKIESFETDSGNVLNQKYQLR